MLELQVFSVKIETVEIGVTSTDLDLTNKPIQEVHMAIAKPTKLIPPNQTVYPKECLVGRVFDRLTVLEFAGRDNSHGAHWTCQCSCGASITKRGGNLKRGRAKTCGVAPCGRSGRPASWSQSHSPAHPYRKTHPAEYYSYIAAKQRCNNPKDRAYPNYGGRGIEFRFDSMEAFLAAVGSRPSPKHSLDRFPNNDGHYEPGNVRWATRTEQQRNRRNGVLLTLDGETLCVTEWAERLGVAHYNLYSRIKRGFCVDCTLRAETKVQCSHRS